MKHYIRFPRADGGAQPPGARRSAGRDVRARDGQGGLLRSRRAFSPQASADRVGELYRHAQSARLRSRQAASGGELALGRHAAHAQRRREDPPLEDRSRDGPPRAQPGRRRALVHPRRRRRAVLRLGAARVPRRRLHRDPARRHVAHRARPRRRRCCSSSAPRARTRCRRRASSARTRSSIRRSSTCRRSTRSFARSRPRTRGRWW